MTAINNGKGSLRPEAIVLRKFIKAEIFPDKAGVQKCHYSLGGKRGGMHFIFGI